MCIRDRLKESPRAERIYAAPGNGGISADAVCVPIKATDIPAMVQFAVSHNVDFCVVAPDDPLVLGMVDAMEEAGIRCFGPNKKAAVLEGSKVFSKELMKKYNIPTARYEIFDEPSAAMRYVKEQDSYPAVIKADVLALGKGVILSLIHICFLKNRASPLTISKNSPTGKPLSKKLALSRWRSLSVILRPVPSRNDWDFRKVPR